MKWNIANNEKYKDLISDLEKYCKITNLQANLLVNRGIDSIEKANKYLYGNLADLYDSYLLKDIDKAIALIEHSINNNEKITIFSDYDADGIGAAAVSIRALRNLGANVDYYIPDRITEGYGLNIDAIRKVYESGTKLIITGDNGITAIQEIELAKELGMKVIVTDHHNCPEILPTPHALINPKQPDCKYPNKDLCGCSVLWKVMECLYYNLMGDLDYIYELLPLVALSTVGDMMKLQDENRILVKNGLIHANRGTIKGLTALKDRFNIDEIKSEDIGFSLGPACNATGRISDASIAVELLISEDEERCKELANQLYELNEERKELTKNFKEKVLSHIKRNPLNKNKEVLVVYYPEIPEGIVGLVCGKIKDEYEVPTFLLTDGENCIKGSGRGVEGHPFDLHEGLILTKDLWTKGGGHKMAAGISFDKTFTEDGKIDFTNIKLFQERLNELAKEQLKDFEDFEPIMNVDMEMNMITEDICDEIEILQPTGMGNDKAYFVTYNQNIYNIKPIGDGSHININFTDGQKATGFFLTEKYLKLNKPNKLDICFSPKVDNWMYNGNRYKAIKLYLKDIDVKSYKVKQKKDEVQEDFNLEKFVDSFN